MGACPRREGRVILSDRAPHTGCGHEHSAAIEEATRWFLIPRELRTRRSAIAEARERFGLTALEAVQAIRDADEIRRREAGHASL